MEFNDNFSFTSKIKGSISSSDEKNIFDYLPYSEIKNNSSNLYHNCRSGSLSLNSNEENSSFSKNEVLPLDKDIIFCDKCKGPYYIIFMDNLDLSFDCGCSWLKNLTTKEYKNEYNKGELFKENNENSLNNYSLHCERHPKESKFDYFCDYCKYDLCKECLKEDSKIYSNTGKIYKVHENHGLIKLDKIIEKFKSLEKSIEEFKDLEENGIYNRKKKKKIKDIFSVIKTLMKFYKEYMCYNFYRSIEYAEIFLQKLGSSFNFGEHENLVCLHKITSKNSLNKIKYFSDLLSISIMDSQIPINLSLFKNLKFPFLEELILINDKINDITPLFFCEFPALKKLNLENNLIDNKVIELLKNIDLPEITFISLYVNKITSLEIFDVLKNFEKLTSFHIGENKFDFKTDIKSFYEFPESIEELGLTGNFDGKNIEFINKLRIGNLKTFYFSRNKLTNLKDLKGIIFKRLFKFWAISNKISDIKEIMNIQNKDNLQIINLKENSISNFNELIDIIKDFPKLEELNVSYNGIKKEEVEEMKIRIKEKCNRNVNIIVENNYI